MAKILTFRADERLNGAGWSSSEKPHGEVTPDCGVLDAIRCWAEGARGRICPVRRMAPGLVMAGRAGWIAPLAGWLEALMMTAARPLHLFLPGTHGTSADEAALLNALGAAQLADSVRLRGLLAPLVRADALEELTHMTRLLVHRLQPAWTRG